MSINFPGWMQSMQRSGRIASATDAYEVVPMLYRAINLRCDAISTVPYTLTRRGVAVDWPWRQSPSELIKATERSLLLTGGAYWYKVINGRTMTGFVVLNPTTMTVSFEPTRATLEDPYSGALFTQTQLGKQYGPWDINSIVYFREPSYRDDILPGLAPAQVALQSSQLGHYLERFTSAFFEGGAQPVMVMNLPESMDDAEFQRFRGEFATRISGVANAFRSLFVRSPELKVQKITPDINTMMLPELQERVITSIAMTLGVPRTMLEASAANYATADSDRQSFWRETITPRLGLYEQILNNQLLGPIGYEIRFNPEMLDVMQADEADRADSLLKLTQAGLDLPNAMRILGYDGVDDMFLTPTVEAPPSELPQEATPQEPTPVIVGAVTPPQPDTSTRSVDWALLAKKLERRIKAGKTPQCNFDSAVISADEVKSVMARLYDGITVHDALHVIDEVKAVDDMTKDERRIYNELVPEFEKRGSAWVRKIMRNEPVDPTLADVIAPVLNRELSKAAQQRIDELGNDIGVTSTDATNDRVVDWLVDYVPLETRLIDATTAERIKKVIDSYRQTEGMTAQDVAALLNPAVDPARALMIARTEIVRAQTQAGIIYQGYLKEKGLTYERIWVTERDEMVRKCPICYPLDNRKESEGWDGYEPPAHPNCRCATALRLVKPEEEQLPTQAQDEFASLSSREQAEFVRSQISSELRTKNAEQQQLHTGLNDKLRERDTYVQGSPEYIQANSELQSMTSRYHILNKEIAAQEDGLYRDVLGKLQHENPQQVRMTSLHGRLSPDEIERVREFVQLGVGIKESDGSTWDISIKPWKSAGMAADGKTIYVNQQYLYGSGYLVHESMHILQARSNYGNQSTIEFVTARTKGEKPKPLGELEPVYRNGLSSSVKGYRDSVADAYTLLRTNPKRSASGQEFPEVLANGITGISGTATTSDPGLFEWWLDTVKKGGK